MKNETGPIRLWLSAQRTLYLGPGFAAQWHRHHAGKICIALEDVLRWRSSDQRCEGEACFVPAHVDHEIEAVSRAAVLYFDADGADYEHACRSYGERLCTLVVANKHTWSELLYQGGDDDVIRRACDELIRVEHRISTERDPRIIAVLALIDQRLHEPVRVEELASEVGASRSWLTHRFSREMGTPLRRYVAWRRLRRALELALQGASLTEAAHRAGFADGAHFSRTYRATFGMAPQWLFELRDRIDVRFAER